VDRLEPIDPDRRVAPVDLHRLTPAEREQERRRRERERERRRRATQPPRRGDGPGIDVRA
jgi:hypothetical protein